jgi:hypothetical protein
VLLNLTGNKYYELGSKLNLQQLADFLWKKSENKKKILFPDQARIFFVLC